MCACGRACTRAKKRMRTDNRSDGVRGMCAGHHLLPVAVVFPRRIWSGDGVTCTESKRSSVRARDVLMEFLCGGHHMRFFVCGFVYYMLCMHSFLRYHTAQCVCGYANLIEPKFGGGDGHSLRTCFAGFHPYKLINSMIFEENVV